jgi:hypothetical protein
VGRADVNSSGLAPGGAGQGTGRNKQELTRSRKLRERVLIGERVPTSEIMCDEVALGSLVDFVPMTNVYAVHVCDPYSEDVVPAE